MVQQQEIFKQVCAQNINTLDDADDQIFEEKDHTFQTVIEKQDKNETVYSSDSDEELPSGEDRMEVDRKYAIFLFSCILHLSSRPAFNKRVLL